MKPWQVQLAKAINAGRWKLTELSDATDITRQDLGRYINRGVEPSLSNAIKIAAALGLSLDEAFVPGHPSETVRVLERLLADARGRVGTERPTDLEALARQHADTASKRSRSKRPPGAVRNQAPDGASSGAHERRD